MKILLAAPGHSYSTRSWAEGLAWGLRELNAEVIPFNYRYVIRFYERALPAVSPEFPAFRTICADDDTFDLAVKSLAADRLPVAILENSPLDAIIVVNGTLYNLKVYEYLRVLCNALDVPWGVILTESPYEDDEQLILLDGASFGTTNDLWSVDRLRSSSKGVPVLYLPAGYDRRVWYCRDEAKVLDWCFVGTRFPEREAFFQKLIEVSRGLGLKYELFWAGEDDRGWLTHNELRELYHKTKVNINAHRVSKTIDGVTSAYDPYSLNPRAYEIAAAGAFQISDYRPEIAEVFGEAVPVWRSGEELVDLVLEAIDEPEWRRECAERARRSVLSHSYVDRAELLVEFLQREVL